MTIWRKYFPRSGTYTQAEVKKAYFAACNDQVAETFRQSLYTAADAGEIIIPQVHSKSFDEPVDFFKAVQMAKRDEKLDAVLTVVGDSAPLTFEEAQAEADLHLPESAERRKAREAEKDPDTWSVLDGKERSEESVGIAIFKHFKREIEKVNSKLSLVTLIRGALHGDIDEYLKFHSIAECVELLQAVIVRVRKGEPGMPDEKKWFEKNETLNAIKDKLLPRAQTLGIARDDIITEANKANKIDFIGQATDGPEYVANAIRVFDEHIAALQINQSTEGESGETTQDDTRQESQPHGDDRALTPEEIRRKYTQILEHFDKKKNKKVQTEYLKVPGRVLLFRHSFRNGCISTELVQITDAGAIFKAFIHDGNGMLLSTGFASALAAGSERFSGRYLEKAETSAIGRALAHAGFGTDMADDIDEGDFLADSPVGQ